MGNVNLSKPEFQNKELLYEQEETAEFQATTMQNRKMIHRIKKMFRHFRSDNPVAHHTTDFLIYRTS